MARQVPIVDRAARDAAACALRAFMSARITNDTFEDAEPDSRDPAIAAIWSTAWCHYDDMEEHRLEGLHAPHPSELRKRRAG